MTTYMGKPAKQINQSMKVLLPETNGCSYADFPMTGKKWLSGKDKAPEGGYCFLRTEATMPKDPGFKQGYVWGSGPFGFGYYHILTKEAHITLYHRIQNRRVFTGESSSGGFCSCCFGSSPEDPDGIPTSLPEIPADDLDNLRRLFHARSVATKPNDVQAQVDQMQNSTATAQASYTYDQNIQLGIGIANTMNRI